LHTEISQGSVAMPLSSGWIFKDDFIANLLVKEFLKSVSIWQSYGQKSSVPVFWFTVYNSTI